ncbi:phosphocarrier protein HPr [Lachnospiraceae bacterium]|jgi:phosphocarrier protein|nr:HPr family phosphocarrier protein [Eubacterium sp.]GFI27043.1 phosphocarrier protein HPr [Lachnospiraceae bacterium]
MKSINYTITDELGIHARPAGLFVKLAGGFQSDITVVKDGKEANAKRIMALMGLSATKGTEITVKVEGPDEDEAVKAVEDFLKANL